MDFCLKQLLIREQYLRKSILAVSISTTIRGSVTQANNQVYVVDNFRRMVSLVAMPSVVYIPFKIDHLMIMY